MESTDTRTLKLEIPGSVYSSEDGINVDNLSGANGWTLVPTSTSSLFWQGTIDLSGYVRQFKTFYPSAAFTQEGPYSLITSIAPVTSTGLLMTTVVSTIPLDPLAVLQQIGAGGGPGFLDANILATGQGQQDWNTVLFAESKVLSPNSTLPPGILQAGPTQQSGSLAATASDTLFVMKIAFALIDVAVGPSYIGNNFLIPASRVIIPGKFGIEPDVEYMMRLKRSTELSQQV